MAAFPKRSEGVLLSSVGDRAIAFDLITETVHQLNSTAGMLLACSDGGGDVDASVDDWARESGAARRIVAADVSAGLRILEDLRLVGRTTPFVAPDVPGGSSARLAPNHFVGSTHRVIDFEIAFRSAQQDLLELIDQHLGTGETGLAASTFFDVVEDPSGELVLVTDQEWRFVDRQQLVDQLTTLLNEYAASTDGCVVFHAGAARSPAGHVVLIPAPSGSGKSTLTAALVAAGWDYLGDEAIGVSFGSGIAVGYPKRIAIDAASRRFLGLVESARPDVGPDEVRSDVACFAGEIAPIAAIYLPTFTPEAKLSVRLVPPDEGVIDLLANTLNLERAGSRGLDAVCALAESVPVRRLEYGDSRNAAEAIAKDQE